MTGVLASVTALLLSVAVLLVGHGLQLTIVPLYASHLGWSSTMIGYTGSAYFSGFVIGCLTVPRLVTRVGHIRVFAALAALATAALLTLGLIREVEVWMVARMITGWSFAGLYMVIESWLNERAATSHRAILLSLYTVITLLAMCGGQLLMGVSGEYLELIMLAAALLALGFIPVGLTRSQVPAPIPPVSFKLKAVYDASHVAVVGAFVGGIVTAGFWALGPIVAQAQGLTGEQIGLFMAATILGGATFQLPIGRLSDKFDRRLVLILIAVLGIAVSALAWVIDGADYRFMLVLMFLFGGVTFPIYSLCLAHANDNTALMLMEVASVILLMHSAGAVVGPLIVAALLDYTGDGLFVVAGVTLMLFAIWTTWRVKTHPVDRAYFAPFVDVPRTTREAAGFYQDKRGQGTFPQDGAG